MMHFYKLVLYLASVLGIASSGLAKPLANPVVDIVPRQTITPGGPPCGQNNATNRRCWKNSWSIDTDYETTNPPAFSTRVVGLDIIVFQIYNVLRKLV